MVTEARKRANAKWDKENMTIIGCKVKKDYAANKGACVMATIIGCLLFGFWFFQALFKASK